MVTNDTNQQPSPSDRHLDEILAELMRAVDAGQSVEPNEWLQRYPDFAADINEYFEKQERMERLVLPLREAAARALNVRCPHCHNPIELLEDARLEEVSCPSCGSSFSLVGEKTVSHYSPGEKTIGHFQLLDRVGVGAFGSVWKARDTQLDRIVAVKIPRNTQLDESQTELFLRDARAAAQLKHPNIVSVHEVGKQDDTIYIVSDFIQGASLKEWLAAKRLTQREIAELCVKVANALHHAHESGVVHRDLKPGNIMMDADGEPHIVDFGLAKREAGEITMTIEGQILGTPAYMSPEQARGEGHTVDGRADIYSIGVILFELLTGDLPFRGEKQMLIVQILNDDPPRLRKLNSSIPRDLETISLTCLQKETRKRYATGKELASDLQRWIDGEPINARPTNAWERGAKWVRRHPATAGLVFASTIAMLSLMAMLIAQYYNGRLELLNEQLGIANSDLEETNEDLSIQSKKLKNALEEVSIERGKARRYLYAARMGLVQRAEQENKGGRVVQLLRSLIPESEDQEDLREFEWFHLWRKHNGETSRLKGHTGVVLTVAWSKDNRLMASGSADDTIKIWNAVTGKEAQTLTGHTGDVTAIAFSPDSQRLVSASADLSIRLWDVLTGQEIHSFEGHTDSITAVAFANDGAQVVSGSVDDSVRVWSILTRKQVGMLECPNFKDLSCYPTTTTVVIATENKTQVWNPIDNTLITEIIPGRKITTSNVGFSPDKQFYFGSWDKFPRMEEGIHVWSIKKKAYVNSWSFPYGGVNHVAVSPDGSQIAASSRDQSVRVWDAVAGKEIYTFHGPSVVRSFAFSPDGSRIVAGTEDRTVVVWMLPDKAVRVIREPATCRTNCVTFGNHGKLLAAVCGNEAIVWDVNSGKIVNTVSVVNRNQRIALSPVASWLAAGPHQSIVDAHTGRPPKELAKPEGLTKPNKFVAAIGTAFSFDGALLSVAGPGVNVWRNKTGELVQSLSFPGFLPSCVVFSPDAKLLAAGAGATHFGMSNRDSGAMCVVERKSGQMVFPATTFREGVWWLSFSPDGKLLAAAMGLHAGGSSLGRIRIWETSTWQIVRELRSHSGPVWSVAFSPSGRRLVSAAGKNLGQTDGARSKEKRKSFGEVKIWDVATWEEVLTMQDEEDGAFGVAFSPNGCLLATANRSGSIKIRDGTPIAESPAFQPMPEPK